MEILNVNGRKFEVGNGDLPLIDEEREEIIRQITRKDEERERITEEIAEKGGGPTSMFSEGVARSLGFVPDMIYKGIEGMGGPPPQNPEAPLFGTENWRQAMEFWGGTPSRREPRNDSERYALGAGGGFGFVLPGAGMAKVVARAPGVLGKIAQSLINHFKKNPKTAVALETSAGGGASVGGEHADKWAGEGNNPYARFGGELGGGFFGAAAPGVAARTLANCIIRERPWTKL